jgi:hypothetical protein
MTEKRKRQNAMPSSVSVADIFPFSLWGRQGVSLNYRKRNYGQRGGNNGSLLLKSSTLMKNKGETLWLKQKNGC